MKTSWLPAGLREGLRCASTGRPVVPLSAFRARIPIRATSKPFSTSSQPRAGIAAPEINFPSQDDGEEKLFYARLVPTSPSYFTAQPTFTDDLLSLQDLLRKYFSLPVLPAGEAPRVAWRSLMDYRNVSGETVKASKYHKIIEILHRLNHIHPSVMPAEVRQALNTFKRDVNPHENVAKPIPIDQFGRALGVGKRKSSTARAWLVEGTGEVLINGKTLAEAFGRVHDRESAIWALKATDRIDKYNVWALVNGGGTTGQAEALTLAVGKALLSHEPALKPALRRAGCVTRDPRRVERKKPGHVKARKMPTWVKR
ncbi:hypothetical protein CJF30_00003288 [Rutstroemia sp. NJR-2017a BBW]|nr:hypothetical protein CJF30_00003288 [Rutstroemia sp. NJR-2017a BBW]